MADAFDVPPRVRVAPREGLERQTGSPEPRWVLGPPGSLAMPAAPQGTWALLSGVAGFLLGVFTVSLLAWHFDGLLGSWRATLFHAVAAPSPVHRWGTGPPARVAPDAAIALPDTPPVPPTLRRGAVGRPAPADPVAALRSEGLLIPVLGVAADALRPSFDAGRPVGRTHGAIDIAAPRHTPVLAAVDGVILRLGTERLGGRVVYQHDASRRFVFYYAHLERFAAGLGEGTEVTRGQVIGHVGTSGNARNGAPHLHFAIRDVRGGEAWWRGTPIDPALVLR